jgi:cell division transport system permease protein
MAAGLLVLGAYLLIVGNMRDVLEQFGSDLRLIAFAGDGESLDVQQAARLAADLGAIDGVADVRFVSPSEALERLQGELGRDAAILKGLERNPLPGSFELEIETSSRSPVQLGAIAALARKLSGISEVRYGEAWVDSYARVVRIVEWVGLGLGIFLVVVLGAIVAGTVRLTVHARSDEIQIQQLVGAGRFFIRLPFYLEGALHGGTAAGLAVLLLYAFWAVGLPIFGEPLEFLRGPAPLEFFGPGQVLTLLLFGVGLGVTGAVVSLLRLQEGP